MIELWWFGTGAAAVAGAALVERASSSSEDSGLGHVAQAVMLSLCVSIIVGLVEHDEAPFSFFVFIALCPPVATALFAWAFRSLELPRLVRILMLALIWIVVTVASAIGGYFWPF